MQTLSILRGLDSNGREVFWTGRTGDFWVSEDRSEAFAALSLEGARRQATKFNAFTELHGLWFVAVSAQG